MNAYVLPPPKVTSLPVVGQDGRFPVRRVICVGRNYADHAREMGNDPDKEPPFFFYKPTDAIFVAHADGTEMPYPPMTSNLHYEIELVVAIGREGTSIDTESAQSHIYGYAVGLDMTRRDLQLKAREMGRPWDWGKGFDKSAPCGPIYTAETVGSLASSEIGLHVNGQTRQKASLTDLIWSVPEIIAHVSASISLLPGDLIFTGTPAGVGPVEPGDQMTGYVEGLGEISVKVI
ncbi:fumarylacetoacetate hydrolase family protein [Orrella marina]|uniref:Fumarylacetoacetase-like C-terminal domain-containing protein n=1 Tax=Orrella marina TaxID=2163011 RepID=A0A2R4XH82_9BURK|nr:fumarylacetoacetate hydrolase family protein [Orrella marina]AWB33166.1 hypothetical protein DBV39_04940 [Orrella marina]